VVVVRFHSKKQKVKKRQESERMVVLQSCLVGGKDAALTKTLFLSLSFFSPPQAHATSVGLRRLRLKSP